MSNCDQNPCLLYDKYGICFVFCFVIITRCLVFDKKLKDWCISYFCFYSFNLLFLT